MDLDNQILAVNVSPVADSGADVRVQALVECLDDCVIELDEDNRITGWNAAAERTYGYSKAEAKGELITCIAPLEMHGMLIECLGRTRAGDPICRLEMVHADKAGGRLDADVTIRRLVRTDGRAAGVFVIVRNISGRKTSSRVDQSLVRALIAAQEEERQRIAYDLHDGLTQFVMASHAHLETYRHANETGRADTAAGELNSGLKYLKEAIVESRRLVNGLQTLALDNMGLASALEQLLGEEKVRAGWSEANFVHNSDRKFDKILSTAVFRVAQEALTNARKHAVTNRVRLMMLESSPSPDRVQLTLEIRDWGKGFDSSRPVDLQAHVGLHSMRERSRLMNAQFYLQTSPGTGTVIRVVFPVTDDGLDEPAGE